MSLEPWIVYQGEGLSNARRDGTEVTRLFPSNDPRDAAHADWSPDGRRIVFQAGVDGSWDIWIADADGSNTSILVDCTAPCINMDAPAWSPDGSSIAFSRLDEVGDALPSMLQVVDVSTGVVTTIASVESGDYVTGPRWSPDGQSIVVTFEDHRGPGGELVENPVASAVAVIHPSDSEPAFELLTPHEMAASYPDWHPKDDRILFQSGENIWWDAIADSTSNLFTIRADGAGLQQITDFGPAQPAIWLPAWSADGSAILATSTVRASRTNSLVLIDMDGSARPLGIGGAHGREQRDPAS